MLDQQTFHLLTREYSLILATDDKDIEAVKTIRRKTLLPVYQDLADIQDEEHFLYNQDDEQSFIYLLRHNPSQEDVGTIRVEF